MKKNESWRVDLDQLTPKQLAKYDDSLEMLNLMRHGASARKASQMAGISIPTAKKYLGSTLKTKNHQVIARKNDSLVRKMRTYEDGKQIFIQVKGRKKATVIGQYLGSVGKRLDKNDINALELFRNITIRDIHGRVHIFETDATKLQQIHEAIEEPEFFTIYGRN